MLRPLLIAAVVCLPAILTAGETSVSVPINQRFRDANVEEAPSFQKHVVPLMSRLGCNGRACHGSFQGRGGFRLSLFGYDFKADHQALFDKESPRVVKDKPMNSLILNKPTSADEHEGGERFAKNGWEFHVFRNWIQSGAHYDDKKIAKLDALEVTPKEILFGAKGQQKQLKAVAVWSDGSREDVTPLCRFLSNSSQVAQVDNEGLVKANETGDTHIVVSYDKAVITIPVIRPVSGLTGNKYPQVVTKTKVDQLVVNKLRKLGVVPSDVCSDAEFLRRVKLDLTGTLPTATEVRKFLNNPLPNKRAMKIDELLKSPGYAAWWTTKLCDFTGNNDRQLTNASPIRGRAGQDWYDWIHKRVKENAPYDKIAEGFVMATSRAPGQSYEEYCKDMTEIHKKDGKKSFADWHSMPYYWARRDFQDPNARAIGFAYTFLGIRIQCAQCHKHPFDRWSKDDFAEFKKFFTPVVARNRVRPESNAEYQKMLANLGLKGKRNNELRRELPKLVNSGKTVPFYEVYAVRPQKPKPVAKGNKKRRRPNRNRNQASPDATLLGEAKVDLTKFTDPREPLMKWLRDPNNPYFAKAFVNRVWASYFNVGIVEPPDDLSLANAPSNAELLNYLTIGFIEHGYDMKWLHREILLSDTYQRSWKPNDTNRKDELNFSHAIPRRLPAEVAYDALQMATASDEVAQRMVTDMKGRAIAIPAASGNNRNGTQYALSIFGRSVRESNCDCDRSSEPTLLQTVFLQNDRESLAKLEQRKDGWIGQIAGVKASPEKPRNYQQTINRYKAQLARAKKSKKKSQIVSIQKQMQKYVKRYAPKKGKAVEISDEKLIEEAYLRTLSRYPSKHEKERCKSYLDEADTKANGLKGLLWALVNTKEFIINH